MFIAFQERYVLDIKLQSTGIAVFLAPFEGGFIIPPALLVVDDFQFFNRYIRGKRSCKKCERDSLD